MSKILLLHSLKHLKRRLIHWEQRLFFTCSISSQPSLIVLSFSCTLFQPWAQFRIIFCSLLFTALPHYVLPEGESLPLCNRKCYRLHFSKNLLMCPLFSVPTVTSHCLGSEPSRPSLKTAAVTTELISLWFGLVLTPWQHWKAHPRLTEEQNLSLAFPFLLSSISVPYWASPDWWDSFLIIVTLISSHFSTGNLSAVPMTINQWAAFFIQPSLCKCLSLCLRNSPSFGCLTNFLGSFQPETTLLH